MADNSIVQLGFALTINTDNDKSDEDSIPLCHQSPYWSNWDGGKIGGMPSWLNPRDVPQHVLRCRGPCSSSSTSNKEGKGKEDDGTIMQFVAQLYCPADDVTNNDAAFHRSLYVFACSKCCNSSTTSTDNADKNHRLSNCIRVLRCQLPKQNDFYPSTGNEPEEDDDKQEWTKHTSQYWATATNNDKLNLCTVCGQVSKGKCPKQQLWFCGPEHQKDCLRLSKQSKGDKNAQSSSYKYSSVCYESELVVEEEPVEEKTTTKSSNDTATTSASNDTNEKTLFPTKDITDSDANLEQSDLNELTGNVSLSQAASTMGVTDPTTLEFYARMSIGGEENDVRDQVLRYNRWPDMNKKEENDGDEEDDNNVGPLWLSSDNRPSTAQSSTEGSFPPPCQYCGARRSFEFQILPQMLHYLLQDPNSSNNDEQPRQVLTESERAVLLEAQTKIESGVDLPEGFKEQHEKVLANARESLLSSSNKSKNDQEGEEMLDWGTIAVYTCRASCGGGEIVPGNEENGAYLEEVAWMQPSLD